MSLGKKVYEKNCAMCHGADLKGIPDQHTPDLTDAEWRFSGDDLASVGMLKFPSMWNGRSDTASAPTIRMPAGWKPTMSPTIPKIGPEMIRKESETPKF